MRELRSRALPGAPVQDELPFVSLFGGRRLPRSGLRGVALAADARELVLHRRAEQVRLHLQVVANHLALRRPRLHGRLRQGDMRAEGCQARLPMMGRA